LLSEVIWLVTLAVGTSAAGLEGSWVVVDRIAVIVGKQAIKTSDVERDLRLTEFLNGQPPDVSVAARQQAAERLIDQQIIRAEIAAGGYARATNTDAEQLEWQLVRDRFGGSRTRLRADLERYSLTEDELRAQLLWQLTVLRFIELKFQPGVSVSDQDVRTYYNQHVADLKRRHPKDYGLAAVQGEIRNSLEGEAVNRDFEEWIGQARTGTRIEYRPGRTP
jgi:hypothetical protein